MEIEEISEKLKTEIKEKAIIPFIGAGFSAHVAPTWRGLLDEIYKKYAITIEEKQKEELFKDFLEAIEYFIWERACFLAEGTEEPNYISGKEYFSQFINTLLKFNVEHDGNGKKYVKNKNGERIYLETHELLIKKFQKAIYTTNWDNLIEAVGGNKFKAISQRNEFNEDRKLREKKKIVIKFHGDASTNSNSGDGLIASKTDYWKRMTDANPFDILFNSDLLKYKFIFIGYSFTDPNISLMIYQVKKLIASMQKEPTIYWAVIEYRGDPRVELLRRHANIEPVFLLSTKNESDLQNEEKDLEDRCKKCKISDAKGDYNDHSLKKYCSDICSLNEKKKALEENRKTYVEKGTINLLNQF